MNMVFPESIERFTAEFAFGWIAPKMTATLPTARTAPHPQSTTSGVPAADRSVR